MFPLNLNQKNTESTVVKGYHIAPTLPYWEYPFKGFYRYPAVKAQGKLSLALQPSDGETFLIDTKTYTWKSTLAVNTDGYIAIGSNVSDSRTNALNAINLDGNPGSQYANATTPHPTVNAKMVGTDIIITALTAGVAGNSIVTTETMAGAGNQFDAGTLGTYRAGADESDADSVFAPSRQGSFLPSSNAIGDAREYIFNAGRGNSNDGWDDNMLFRHTEFAYSYNRTNLLLAASGVRKYFAPSFYEGNIQRIRHLNVLSKLKDLTYSTLASPYNANSSNVVFKKIVLDTTRFVIFYKQAGGTTGTYAVAGQTASDGTITWGTPLLLDDDQYTNENFGACLINTDKIAYSMRHGASNYIHANILSVSTLTLTIGTQVQIAAVASDRKDMVKVGTDKFLIAFHNSSNINIYCCTVSGTVITVGGNTTVTGGSQPIFCENGTDKAQILYLVSSKWQTNVVSVSGSTPGINTAIQIANDGSFNFFGTQIKQVATDKFLVYSSAGYLGATVNNRPKVRFAIITVSGVVSTVASTAEVLSSWYDTNSIDLVELTAGSEWIFYRFDGSKMTGVKITIDPTTNALDINDNLIYGIGYREQDSNNPCYVSGLWQSMGQAVFVKTNHGTFVVTICADSAYTFGYFGDKSLSLDIYVNDDLLGTYSKTLPLLAEAVKINAPIGTETFTMKIVNKDTVSRYIYLQKGMVDLK